PSPVHRTTSPVRYNRPPPLAAGSNGSATNWPAVSPGRPAYPRASCTPARYNSPATPAGTGASHSSSTNTRVFATGRPIGTAPGSPPRTRHPVTSTVASVGPYKLNNPARSPNTEPNRSRAPPPSASPEHTTRRSHPHAPAWGTPRNASSIDGTKGAAPTRSARISPATYPGSR